MTEWLSCGRYLIRMEGTPALPQDIRFRRDYRLSAGDRCPDAVLYLEKELNADEGALEEGWLPRTRGAVFETVYYTGSRPAFSLQLDDTLCPQVTVRYGSLAGSVRIGIQYGVMLALARQCIGLHGVTLLCGDEILILSAPSGTGKTTLARLLESHCGAVTINGDFALLSVSEDGVIFEPTPFCGSSGRCLNHRLRVGRLVFLEQAGTNAWYSLSGREALLRFMNNAFVPSWDGCLQRAVQENVMRCISSLKMNAFAFTPTREAAELFCEKTATV